MLLLCVQSLVHMCKMISTTAILAIPSRRMCAWGGKGVDLNSMHESGVCYWIRNGIHNPTYEGHGAVASGSNTTEISGHKHFHLLYFCFLSSHVFVTSLSLSHYSFCEEADCWFYCWWLGCPSYNFPCSNCLLYVYKSGRTACSVRHRYVVTQTVPNTTVLKSKTPLVSPHLQSFVC